jgi:hypothetical protein
MSGSAETKRGKKNSLPRPFPAITAKSYLPGSAAAGAGLYPGYGPPTAANQYPGMNPNSTPPPIRNFNTGSGLPPPPPPSYNPMFPPTGPPPAISYPNVNTMQRPDPSYNQRFASYPYRRRLMPAYRRHRSSRSRPVIRIIRSDSCISISTCSTISSCSSHCHRSCSYSTSQQQQQQPIILLPIQCQQQPLPITGSVQGQSQPIVLPSTQFQQQPMTLPPISNISSTPVIIQPLNSMSTGGPQQFQAGPIQYVQAKPQSTPTSQLQFISVKQPSSIAPQRVLVNSANKKQSTVVKPSSSIASRRVVFVNGTNKKQSTVVKPSSSIASRRVVFVNSTNKKETTAKPIQGSVTTHNRPSYDLKLRLNKKEKHVLFK